MKTVKYTTEEGFMCLEDLRGTSTELSLVHVGKEQCKPYHAFVGTRDEYIIHFILSGRGFYSVNGTTWPLCGGQMFLIYPNDSIVYCADSNDPWSYCWVGFNGSTVEAILKQCGFTKNRLVLPAPDTDEFLGCFDDFFAHVALTYSDGLYRESVLLRLLSILCCHYSQCYSGNPQENVYSGNQYISQAIDYVNGMYAQGITVSDIASHVGISRSHLNHLFQEELNVSAQNFLLDFRMNKAANLLANTAMSVKEISHHIGYVDPLVFSKAFKRKFGISPKEYRKYEDKLETREKRPESVD